VYGWGVRYGWIGGRKDGYKGVYRFSSLMKQNKKGKIALSFASPEKENYYIYIYAVITWEIFHKRAANHYSWGCERDPFCCTWVR
jgi:hypothetical protein